MLKIYNEEEFYARIRNIDGIFLFGAGKRLGDVERFFQDRNISGLVSGIIDNDVNKQGKRVRLWGKEYEIGGVKQLKADSGGNRLILITLEDYGDLLEELLQEESLRKEEIVCFSHMIALQKEAKSMHKRMPGIFRLEDKQLIPKKIHYCWFGGKPLPDKYKRYMESWYKFCPDYEIIEWNESNYDVSKCKYMYDAYQKEVWGFVPDYARIDIVCSHGGIYLDTDVELIRNLDDLLYQKGFAGFEDENYVNLGSGFGAVKGLPVLQKMLEYYDSVAFVQADGELNLIASPIHNTNVLIKHGLLDNGEYQRVADMTIYPAKVLVGKCMYTMRTVIRPWTYAIHHYDGSWATARARRINARMEQDMKLYHAGQDEE